jgi:hypothetical protein
MRNLRARVEGLSSKGGRQHHYQHAKPVFFGGSKYKRAHFGGVRGMMRPLLRRGDLPMRTTEPRFWFVIFCVDCNNRIADEFR